MLWQTSDNYYHSKILSSSSEINFTPLHMRGIRYFISSTVTGSFRSGLISSVIGNVECINQQDDDEGKTVNLSRNRTEEL